MSKGGGEKISIVSGALNGRDPLEGAEPTFIILQLSSAFPGRRSPPPRKRSETKVGLMKIQKVNGGRRDVLNARVYNRKEERERVQQG